MKVVDENTVVEVGKMYNVRCAVIKAGYSDEIVGCTPIIGERHKDVQFGVDYIHYHVDGRFARRGDWIEVDEEGKTNAIVEIFKVSESRTYMGEVVIRKRKCKRLTTGIKPPPKAEKYNAWYKTMIGKSCKGRKCPHLGTKMMEENGVLVCPLHNLHGDLITEKIIPL